MHATIVIAVRILGNHNVKPSALFAKVLAGREWGVASEGSMVVLVLARSSYFFKDGGLVYY